MLAPSLVSLGILAGGRSQRLGGQDKSRLRFEGRTLLERTLASMAEGYAAILLSHNAEPELPPSAQIAVVGDLRSGFPGPLAGIEALLSAARSPWLLTLPVDLKFIPVGLPGAILSASVHDASGVVVIDADGLQPLVALWPVQASLPAVSRALDAGQAAVHVLVRSLEMLELDISPLRMGNLNTPGDFC